MTDEPSKPRKFKVTGALSHFATVLMPDACEPPILARPIRETVHQWLVEIGMTEELKAVKVKPRRSGLFGGPPGCGKTTLAHHFAARLGLPLVVLSSAAITSCYIGQTGNQIVEFFRDMEKQYDLAIPFFDEFDALASKRGVAERSADKERNAIVIALLQCIDTYSGLFLAATNVIEGIDPALHRRFDIRMDINLPDAEARFAILRRYLDPFEMPDDDMDILVEVTDGATPAILRQLMEGVKRDLVLAPKFKYPPFARPTFERQIAAIQPHNEDKPPPLWAKDGEAMKKIARITWPPTRPTTQEQAA